MGKFALLIGVGKYRSAAFANLAAAKPDVNAMQTVLLDPDVGEFASEDVRTLLNPEPQQMREALERLFSEERKPDDLLVLYFSGHGVVDDRGQFHLTTVDSNKGILKSTAIPASFILGLMEDSRSKHQVVILDCCFSGAFAKGMMAKGNAVNFQAQLGGKGRAVLTSCSASEYSFERKEAELSVYTQYLVEGLKTGIADEDGDGLISVDELHEFVKARVRETFPGMKPKIYPVEEGYRIILAKARKVVEQLAIEQKTTPQKNIKISFPTKFVSVAITLVLSTGVIWQIFQSQTTTSSPSSSIDSESLDEKSKNSNIDSLTPLLVGIGSYNKGDNKGAIASLDQVIKLEPDNGMARYVRGNARRNLDDNKGAIADFDQAIKLEPDDGMAYYSRGITRRKLDDNKGAIADFDQAIKLKPDFAEAYCVRGITRSRLGDRKGAIADFDQAIKLKPDFAEAYYSRGFLDDNKGAIADFDQAIKLKPDFAEAYKYRGITRSRLGDKKGAIADFDQAIKLKPDFAEAYYSRGFLRIILDDNKGAIADFDQAIKLKPDFADAYSSRGYALSKLDNRKGAIADYQKAVELYPSDDPSRQLALDAIKRLQS